MGDFTTRYQPEMERFFIRVAESSFVPQSYNVLTSLHTGRLRNCRMGSVLLPRSGDIRNTRPVRALEGRRMYARLKNSPLPTQQ